MFILVYPEYDKEFILYTDARDLAIEAILAKLDNESVAHPVAYTSCVLNKHEKNYSVTEKECLAVLHAVKQFIHYVYGTHFTVVTEHALLKWLQQLKEAEGRLARWALRLQGLTSLCSIAPGFNIRTLMVCPKMPILALHSAEADRLYELIGYPSSWENKTEEVQLALSKLSEDTLICDNQLFKKVRDQYLPYVLPSLCLLLVLQAHKETGHGGIVKTFDWLQKNYFWENLCLLIPDIIASCHNFQLQRP